MLLLLDDMEEELFWIEMTTIIKENEDMNGCLILLL
jgi:hypothetical protein